MRWHLTGVDWLSESKVEREKACYAAFVKWHRIQLFQEWRRALIPQLYPQKPDENMTFSGLVAYMAVALFLLPFSIVVWLLSFVYESVRYPVLLLASILPPKSYSVGERNIQGIHNAFVQYAGLTPDNYIRCVDDWITILYGPEVLKACSFACCIDHSLIRKMRGLYSGDMDEHYGRIFANARERFSKKNGNY